MPPRNPKPIAACKGDEDGENAGGTCDFQPTLAADSSDEEYRLETRKSSKNQWKDDPDGGFGRGAPARWARGNSNRYNDSNSTGRYDTYSNNNDSSNNNNNQSYDNGRDNRTNGKGSSAGSKHRTIAEYNSAHPRDRNFGWDPVPADGRVKKGSSSSQSSQRSSAAPTPSNSMPAFTGYRCIYCEAPQPFTTPKNDAPMQVTPIPNGGW